MGEEQLLQLSTLFLQSPQGEKFINEQVDFDQLEEQLVEFDGVKFSTLTREERKERRAERRAGRKLSREERKEKIKKLKEESKLFIPVIKSFKVKGRVYDKQTGKPVEGAPITGLFLNISTKKPKTDSQGEFEIEIKLPILPVNGKVLNLAQLGENTENLGSDVGVVESTITPGVQIQQNTLDLAGPQLTYTKSGYVPTTQNILNRDNTVKTDLNLASLVNIDESAKQVKSQLQNEIDKVNKTLPYLYQSAPELVLVARRKSIMNVTKIIKTRLLPLALGLLVVFGITKLSQKAQKTCPSKSQLEGVIRKRNRVVRQLNQIYIALIANTALAAIFLALGGVIKSARLTIDNLPVPLSVPPGVGLPYSFVGKLQNINRVLKKLEEDNKDLNKQIIVALVFLVVALTTILLLLKGIDNLTQECAGGEELEYEEISQELLDLTQEAEEEGSPVLNNVNGFIMGVETSKNSVGSLKRRYAVAKNPQGVTILKGEPSFSSSDQILIDELAFYITSNNLKAY